MQRLISDVNSESIDHVVQDFTRYLHDNAFEVFGQTIRSKSQPAPGKKVNNNWFDEKIVGMQRTNLKRLEIYLTELNRHKHVLNLHVREHVTTRLRKRLNSNVNVMRAST